MSKPFDFMALLKAEDPAGYAEMKRQQEEFNNPELAKRRQQQRQQATQINQAKQRLEVQLFEAMRAKHWLQADLAAALGVGQSSVSHLLNRKGNPRLGSLLKVCQVLDVEMVIRPKSSVTIGKNN